VAEDQQPLVLVQAKIVLRVVEQVEEGSTSAELHDDDLAAALLLLLDGQQLDNVLVLYLL